MRTLFNRLLYFWKFRFRRTWNRYPLNIFRHGRPCRVPLKPYLQRFTRPDCWVWAPYYRLSLSTGTSSEIIWDQFRDGEYGFVLTTLFHPIALITWDMPANDILWVRQIQGVRGAQVQLRPLRWEKMLLQIAMDWAAANGFREVRIQNAKKHKWAQGTESMRMKYEITAKRMGFRFNAETDSWNKTLAPAGV